MPAFVTLPYLRVLNFVAFRTFAVMLLLIVVEGWSPNNTGHNQWILFCCYWLCHKKLWHSGGLQGFEMRTMSHEKGLLFGYWKGDVDKQTRSRTHDDIIGQISFIFKEGKCAIEGPGTFFSTSSFLSDSLLLTLVINKLSVFKKIRTYLKPAYSVMFYAFPRLFGKVQLQQGTQSFQKKKTTSHLKIIGSKRVM